MKKIFREINQSITLLRLNFIMKVVTAILLICMLFYVNSAVVTAGYTGAKTGVKYYCNSCKGTIIKLDDYVNYFKGYNSFLCTPSKRNTCNCSTLRFISNPI
jgi:hypothetical protein